MNKSTTNLPIDLSATKKYNRNSPCPFHGGTKLKNCNKGRCLEKLKSVRHRASVGG